MALAFRKASVAVPTKAGTAPRVAAPRPSVRASRVAMRAEPQQQSAIEKALQEAEECGDPKSKECAPAWDNVEEASAAAAHKKQNETQDPMEKFCEGNEDADECRVYE
uniref:CP12 domain-containing protein n=2 Tax=Eukaryota TaxID=2759 RepID=A0A7S3VV57_DUNTE|mmetsp:Transcript_10056/g.27527  ORF Transcript_10056/g.27527 Transcript_10056/m.27527 type:complete len:108 (-) Transcript_10056:428-751(-)|eukprot:CAMPEP_0202347894 /NCGR_PEP_ID=MMETSP1126-20121109/6065_1 /ASSEMBLY_ACC=CAM_ASM_000457 /TAXON_ID=3047 /ORGANISM="Dunaliella tertiolecta, Strain CCMP1320" /LENGTH=107 /DNA_ID=CAMNT_0048939519 /DNA_START=63 /DNA_END=386 /DNA_ORIENTATION=+